MTKLLLIEDDKTTALAVEMTLAADGFEIDTTDLAEEGFAMAEQGAYGAILLDLNLPDGHGVDVLRRLRAARVDTPVLILSGFSDLSSKVSCLGYGADDYVTKPFHREELLVRVHAVLRRAAVEREKVFCIGGLRVNVSQKVADFEGVPIALTGKEFAILEALARRRGATLTKDMILSQLYEGMDEPAAKIIDVFMCRLRQKLAPACGGAVFIETVWGGGYKLCDAREQALAA